MKTCLWFSILLLCASSKCYAQISIENADKLRMLAAEDTNSISALLEQGWDINGSISGPSFDNRIGLTAIFIPSTPSMLQYLVNHGANPHVFNRNGELPIDDAYQSGAFEAVEYFAKNHPYHSTRMIADYPQRLIEGIMSFPKVSSIHTVYVCVNWAEPPPQLLSFIQSLIPGAKGYGVDSATGVISALGVSYEWDKGRSVIAAKHPDARILYVNASVSKVDDTIWDFFVSYSDGPLSGAAIGGVYEYVEKYDHWIYSITESRVM